MPRAQFTMDEITAEFASQALLPAKSLSVRPKVTVAGKTDLGRVRENNEDKYEFFLPEQESELASRGMVFLVCDGMGGHAAGQIASELTVNTFLDVYRHHPGEEPDIAMRAAVVAANRYVMDVARAVPSRRGMGTTLTALAIIQDEAVIAQVGDSRLYRVRDGVAEQLSEEHTWVDEAIRMGAIQPEEAGSHPYRHVLTRAIGTEDNVEPDVKRFPVREGDIFLLCSDGLTNHVGDALLGEILSEYGPSEAAWRLVAAALQDGGSDNCTALVVRVDGLDAVG